MIYAIKLFSTLVVIGLTALVFWFLVSIGFVKTDTFPFIVLTASVGVLTVAVNEVVTYFAGITLENKAMKERQTLSELLDNKLKPIEDKLSSIEDALLEVKTNQITLVTELRTQGVIQQTPIMSK
ncbi:MAG: hypothetical protein ACRCXZ_08625 [Patescibacteria group bacterium]